MPEFTVGPLRSGETDEMLAIVGRALHFPPDPMRYWYDGVGAAGFRVIRAAGQAIGGLGLLPMGQFFGGARLPMAGITAVGIAPEWRGRGAASALLRATLAELRAAGTPLAALYPSTLPVYRKAGFERAATNTTYELPLTDLSGRAPLEAVPSAADHPDLAAVYARHIAGRNGALDRHPFIWHRACHPYGRDAALYRFVRDGATEGYISYSQDGRGEPLIVHDWACLSRDAMITMLAFLAGHRAMVGSARLFGAPQEPLLQLLPEPRATIARRLELLLRLVDVPAALAARGYPAYLTADLHLAVADDFLPENSGNLLLRVVAGRGTVERGGAGTFRIGTRALASLYSGFLAPHDLALLGGLDAPPADLASAAAIFGGPPPWLGEMF